MADTPPRWLRFERALSLTGRILAINILIVALLAGGFVYLDSYRSRLVEERQERLSHDLSMLAVALQTVPPEGRDALLLHIGTATPARIRLYGDDGRRVADSFALGPRTYSFQDPNRQDWTQRAARNIDRIVDTVVFARRPGQFREPRIDSIASWRELRLAAAQPGVAVTSYRFAPDRTPMIAIALQPNGNAPALLLTSNARDITETVRAERLRLTLALAVVTMMSILLSLFLARTIVSPLQRLARAATRVRLGRARDVVVPRLPARRDEIGQLARALSDMTQALRLRIDAGEHLAADIAHELKNPIASLRSALEGLRRIDDADLRVRLLAIAEDDVRRLDRLITDIAALSRVDAELSRSHFQQLDINVLVADVIDIRRARASGSEAAIAMMAPAFPVLVEGDETRLARVIDNLVDNALSFAPRDSIVSVTVSADASASIRVEDDGPGIAADQREAIFRRFHSFRPDSGVGEQHSGLGLAIARAIVEAHDGTLQAIDRPDGKGGACFDCRLPLSVRAGE